MSLSTLHSIHHKPNANAPHCSDNAIVRTRWAQCTYLHSTNGVWLLLQSPNRIASHRVTPYSLVAHHLSQVVMLRISDGTATIHWTRYRYTFQAIRVAQ